MKEKSRRRKWMGKKEKKRKQMKRRSRRQLLSRYGNGRQ
jgi:hypothetical protein